MATSELEQQQQQQQQGAGAADNPQGIAPADALRHHSFFAGAGGNRTDCQRRYSRAVVVDGLMEGDDVLGTIVF